MALHRMHLVKRVIQVLPQTRNFQHLDSLYEVVFRLCFWCSLFSIVLLDQ